MKRLYGPPPAFLQEITGHDLKSVNDSAAEERTRLLLTRGVCDPMHRRQVTVVDGTQFLNGLLGVRKPKLLGGGKPVLKPTMNLTPVGGLQRTSEGHVDKLPNRTAQGIVLGQDEQLFCYPSDLAAMWRRRFISPRFLIAWLPWLEHNLAQTLDWRAGGRAEGVAEHACVNYL